MSDLGLTEHERIYLERLVNSDQGVARRLWFYAAVFSPPTAFAVYGIAKQDFVAEAVAFSALAVVTLWRVSEEFRSLHVFMSIIRKVADHERTSGGASRPAAADERRG